VHHPRVDLQLARYAGFDSLGGELADLGVVIATTVSA